MRFKWTVELSHSTETNSCAVSLWLDSSIHSANQDPGLPARLHAQLKLVVVQLSTSKPGLVIGDIDFTTKVDLKDSNASMTPMPPTENSLLHELTMQDARKTPDTPTLCAWDGTIMYADFDAVIASLALMLRAAGVTFGTCIPLVTVKSLWGLVFMLAINKTGGAFVTLPSETPVARMKSIIDQRGIDDAPCQLDVSSKSVEGVASSPVPPVIRVG